MEFISPSRALSCACPTNAARFGEALATFHALYSHSRLKGMKWADTTTLRIWWGLLVRRTPAIINLLQKAGQKGHKSASYASTGLMDFLRHEKHWRQWLSSQPPVLSHHDLSYNNLLESIADTDPQPLRALDWDKAGLAVPGFDLAVRVKDALARSCAQPSITDAWGAYKSTIQRQLFPNAPSSEDLQKAFAINGILLFSQATGFIQQWEALLQHEELKSIGIWASTDSLLEGAEFIGKCCEELKI